MEDLHSCLKSIFYTPSRNTFAAVFLFKGTIMFTFYFTNIWNDFTQAQKCTWDIVECVITHQEGHIAKSYLKVGNFTPPLTAYLGIFEDEKLLFQGLISGQFEYQQHLTKVDILGISPTFEEDVKMLLKKESLPYNPLFFQHNEFKPSDYLEASNKLFYWDRTTGKISLSDYFKGNRCIDVSGKYLEKSFKIQQISMPLGSAVIDLKVHWTQHLGGIFDASPYIERAFPEKVIATLTPETIVQHWPKEDQRLGIGKRKSGYQVEHSKITAIDPDGAPTYTSPIDKGNEQSIQAKIHYFKTTLKIQWQYQQTRVEIMQISAQLNHCQHTLTKHRGRRIPIEIELPETEQATFFETTQGQEFIAYATAILHAQLKASSRCIRVICTLPWHLGRDLTVDDSLMAGEKFTGKITKIRHIIKGTNRFVEVEIRSTLEPGNLHDEGKTHSNTVQSPDDISGITQTTLNPLDLITQIDVKNSATTQEAHLLQRSCTDKITTALQEVPTSIHLTLRDLRTDKTLVRNFEKILPLVLPL